MFKDVLVRRNVQKTDIKLERMTGYVKKSEQWQDMPQTRTQSRAQVSLKKKVAEGHLPKLPDKAPDDKTCTRLAHKSELKCH